MKKLFFFALVALSAFAVAAQGEPGDFQNKDGDNGAIFDQPSYFDQDLVSQDKSEPLGPPGPGDGQEMGGFKLSPEKIGGIKKILDQDRANLQKYRAEIKILQAQLAKILIDTSPNTADIEKIVRQSLDWEYKIRMIQVQRHIQIKALLGNDDWTKLYRMARMFRERMSHFNGNGPMRREGQPPRNDSRQFKEQNLELFGILGEL